MHYRIGIDVGGTNTDAVVLDDAQRVIASIKTPTTADTGIGVDQAVEDVIAASGIAPSSIAHVMLGTTHCTNAIVERRGLGRVAVVRLGAPATTSVPPMEGWPEDLRTAVDHGARIISGGFEHDGSLFARLDEVALREFADSVRGRVDAVAVVGVFSPVDPAQEDRAAHLLEEWLGIPVSRSARIGAIGLLERENATVLNAALVGSLGDMLAGLEFALRSRGIDAQMWVGQNDGTLMKLSHAREFPVLTVGSGLTNSLRGAAHLADQKNAIVLDIGGTTTDAGVLVDGFPRVSSRPAEIGGIRTNFRMPDLLSIGLGGGSIVNASSSPLRVGPRSVGYRISREALAFGGQTTTATDVALASGARIDGVPAPEVDPRVRQLAHAVIRARLEDTIDRMKVSADPATVILVGGGGIIAPDQLEGVSTVIRPPHFGAANAVGAALGDISGESELMSPLSRSHREAIQRATNEATERAVSAGADPSTIEVVDISETPVPYMDEPTVILRVRVVGRLLAVSRRPSPALSESVTP